MGTKMLNITGLTINYPSVPLTPRVDLIANVMYGDADSYVNETVMSFRADNGLCLDQNKRKVLRDAYNREPTIHDALVFLCSVVDEDLERYLITDELTYSYTWAHPTMDIYFDNITFSNDMLGDGCVVGWSLVYIDSNGASYPVSVTHPDNHNDLVEQIRSLFF